MDNVNYNELKETNIDLLFFFLLFLSSIIALYIIINKKKKILHKKCASDDTLDKLFKFKIYLAIIINIYFVINAYDNLEKIKNKKNYTKEEYDSQLTVLIANILILLGSVMYLSLTNSDFEITR